MLELDKRVISRITNADYILAIQMGLVTGFDVGLDKYGYNPLITSITDPEDIWEQGGLYTFSDDETQDIDRLSSSNALDTGQLIKISGILNEDTEGTKNVWGMTDGQADALLYDNPELTGSPVKIWRSDRMGNDAAFGEDIAGTLYLRAGGAQTAGVPDTASTIRAIITAGNKNQTQMCIYTTRPKKVSFLIRWEIGMQFTANQGSGTDYAIGQYMSKKYGKVWRVKKPITVGTMSSSNYKDRRTFPDILPALTDIKLNILEVSDNMGIWGTFDILSVNEDLFSNEYLTDIGQPGR